MSMFAVTTKGGLYLGFGKRAFAHDGPVIAGDADDGGRKDRAGVARIEYQRETVAKLFHDLLRVGAGRKAGEIGAGSGDGAADGFDQCGCDVRIGPAQGDAPCVPGDLEREAMSGFDDERERTGPEFVRKCEKHIGNIANERDGLLDGIDQNGQSFRFRTALDAENFLDRGEVQGVGSEPIKRVGRNADDAAAPDEARGIVNDSLLRGFR